MQTMMQMLFMGLFSVAAWVNQPRRAPLALHSNPLHRAHKI
jgi:hypothetical protein